MIWLLLLVSEIPGNEENAASKIVSDHLRSRQRALELRAARRAELAGEFADLVPWDRVIGSFGKRMATSASGKKVLQAVGVDNFVGKAVALAGRHLTANELVKAAQMAEREMLAGKSLTESVREGHQKRAAELLASKVKFLFPELHGQEQLGELRKRYGFDQALRKRVASGDLTDTEAAELERVLNAAAAAGMSVLVGSVERSWTSIKNGEKRLKDVERQMASNADNVQKALDQFAARMEDYNQGLLSFQSATDFQALDFERRVAIASACEEDNARGNCSTLSDQAIRFTVARGAAFDAARQVQNAIETYGYGAIAIAKSLGVDVPPAVIKVISGVSAGAQLVAGVFSGDPRAIFQGVVGIFSIFGDPPLSPEMQALARVEESLKRIEERLDRIEQKLDAILELQLRTFDLLSKVDVRVADTQTLVAFAVRYANYSLVREFTNCNNCYFDQSGLGPWADLLARSRLVGDGSVLVRSSENQFRLRQCVRYVQDSLAGTPNDLPLLAAADRIADDEKAFASQVARDDLQASEAAVLLGESWQGRLELAFIPEAFSRSDIIGRFRLSATSTISPVVTVPRLRRYESNRVLNMLGLAVVTYQRNSEPRSPGHLLSKEAVLGAHRMLERHIVQFSFLEGDGFSAVVGSELERQTPERQNELVELVAREPAGWSNGKLKRLVADLAFARLWRIAHTAEEQALLRLALGFAMRSGNWRAAGELLRGGGPDNDALEVRLSAKNHDVLLCLRMALEGLPEPEAACIVGEDLERLDGDVEARRLVPLRHWQRLVDGYVSALN